MAIKIEAITSNSYSRLTNNDINPIILDEFMLKIINRRQKNFAFFLLFLLKIATRVGNCHFV